MPKIEVVEAKLSLNQSLIPISDIGVTAAPCKLHITPLALSDQNTLLAWDISDSGFFEIPYSPLNGVVCPNTLFVAVNC